MRNKTVVPAATFKTLLREGFSAQFIYALLRSAGVRRSRPPELSPAALIYSLAYPDGAGRGT